MRKEKYMRLNICNKRYSKFPVNIRIEKISTFLKELQEQTKQNPQEKTVIVYYLNLEPFFTFLN